MKPIPLLIDFDGVIRIEGKPAPDAKDFLRKVSELGIPAHFISNSTLRNADSLSKFLQEHTLDFGIPAMTAADATLNYIREHYRRAAVYCIDSIRQTFDDLLDYENPEVVVIGDLEDAWSYEVLNEMFRFAMDGADLVAMQQNRYWKPEGKSLSLDAGPFVKAIEYATGKEARLIGKPSELYFRSALSALGQPDAERFIMIGDDLESDVKAAQAIGGAGILIFTGKTKHPLPQQQQSQASHEVHSLTEALEVIISLQA